MFPVIETYPGMKYFSLERVFTPRVFKGNLLEIKKTVNNDILKKQGVER